MGAEKGKGKETGEQQCQRGQAEALGILKAFLRQPGSWRPFLLQTSPDPKGRVVKVWTPSPSTSQQVFFMPLLTVGTPADDFKSRSI